MARRIRRFLVRVVVVSTTLIAIALIAEAVLEARDVARFMPGQTFTEVGAARIRYRLLGVEHAGAPVVILTGMGGTIEQLDDLQSALSTGVPTLSYDRAGYGFSENSTAHSSEEQADELVALLHALKIEKPVVLVGYSYSAGVARIFAGRYPTKTAAVYLIAPVMPEVREVMPWLHLPRRYLARSVLQQMIKVSVGYIRLVQRLRSWQGPESVVEQRVEAVLSRRPHYWALTREWYASPESWRQTIEAPVPSELVLELVFPKSDDRLETAYAKLGAALVARTSRGKLVETRFVDHSMIIRSGPVLDYMVGRIVQLSRAAAPMVPAAAGN